MTRGELAPDQPVVRQRNGLPDGPHLGHGGQSSTVPEAVQESAGPTSRAVQLGERRSDTFRELLGVAREKGIDPTPGGVRLAQPCRDRRLPQHPLEVGDASVVDGATVGGGRGAFPPADGGECGTGTRGAATAGAQGRTDQAAAGQAYYVGAVPLDLLKRQQERLSDDLLTTKALVVASTASFERLEDTVKEAVAGARNCHAALPGGSASRPAADEPDLLQAGAADRRRCGRLGVQRPLRNAHDRP